MIIPKKIQGYADLHAHMFAELSYGGGWFTGTHQAKTKQEVYRPCGPGESESTLGKFFRDYISIYLSGFFSYNDCIEKPETNPHSNTINKHQIWSQSLKQALDTGLKLVVVSIVAEDILCQAIPKSRQKFPCGEDLSVERQLKAFKSFDAQTDWIQLATTPKEARSIIADGKLAAVLSVEVHEPFTGKKNFQSELEKYREQGITTLQPIHLFNNRYGGAAISFGAIKWLQLYKSYKMGTGIKAFDTYEEDGVKKNKLGLTEEGKQIVQKMMDLKMMVDMAHMGERSVNDTYEIAKKNNDYPLYVSHGHLRDVMLPPRGTMEKPANLPVIEIIKKTGGLIGLRTSPDGTRQISDIIKNDCQGSSKSFAQAVEYAKKHQLNIAFGSDLNGFAPMTKPRFGKKSPETCGDKGKLGKSFDQTGLGQIAQLSDLILDLNQLGADTSSLLQSAENYIAMWEKAYKPISAPKAASITSRYE